MKRFAVTLAIAFFSLCSFANDNEVIAPKAIEAFQSSFKNVSQINWTVSENYFKANFVMNGQHVAAYYNGDGQMIALTRNISSIQLPIALQARLKNDYDAYWISDLFEMANDEGTSYYITLEDADTKIVLRSTGGSDWTTFRKLRKS